MLLRLGASLDVDEVSDTESDIPFVAISSSLSSEERLCRIFTLLLEGSTPSSDVCDAESRDSIELAFAGLESDLKREAVNLSSWKPWNVSSLPESRPSSLAWSFISSSGSVDPSS